MSETFEIVVPEYPKKINGLVCEEIEGENTYFYIHEDNGTTLTLNIIASAIFDMCDGSNTAEGMAEVVSQTLEVSDEDALRDVREILQELTGFGFIQS
jgi:hypothetical protein